MKKSILITTAASLALAANLLAGPANDIAAKHAAASAEELEAYIAKNPDAEDKAEAVEHLLGAYSLTGNDKRIAELMQVKFDAIKGGADIDPQELYMTTMMLFQSMVDAGDKAGAKTLIDAAIEKGKDHQAGPQLAQAFNQMKADIDRPDPPAVGDTMEIKFKSVQGDDIDLAKMKGKVVLVDFWATWCGPCIRELPHVQETYEKYHDKGFEVLAISLDREEGALKKFIEEKKLPWPQAFEGANELATKYSITGIPATFLIGTDGKIAATNLRGAALEKAVAKQLEAK